VLPRVVAARMAALGLTAAADYAARLTADAQEFQTLVGELAVPETWFFRGGEVFDFLVRHIAAAVRLRPPGVRFRALSVPCSTGEEPYSLALALVEAGVPPAAWRIEGVDLSARLVERACRGWFGDFAFRQTAPELRARYFRPVDSDWELAPHLRALVHFSQGNLLTPLFLAGEEPFDLVFCRNLLIYLHSAARRRVLEALDRLLARTGLLCTGHAEPVDFLDPRFERTGPAGAFLYRRAASPAPAPAPVVAEFPRLKPAAPPAAAERPASMDAVDRLARARQLADAGRLDEALATCQAHLGDAPPSADLFALMGVLHQARREGPEAVRHFQRALYLDPGHRDALTHLMLLCQEQGDHRQARRLRRRLERAAPGGEA
jgi:chemotaxis protein methyltransferase WspC